MISEECKDSEETDAGIIGVTDRGEESDDEVENAEEHLLRGDEADFVSE